MADLERFWERLEAAGYKRTEARRALLAAVAARSGPFSAAEIYAAVRTEAPGVGRATVFRTLDLLAALGLAQRIGEERAGSGALYVACPGAHHHHLICSACKGVSDFAQGELEALIAAVAAEHGFAMLEHRVELYGQCAGCRAGRGPRATRPAAAVLRG
jgi:Fur family transcriptional regulator, ferric uptake regulator